MHYQIIVILVLSIRLSVGSYICQNYEYFVTYNLSCFIFNSVNVSLSLLITPHSH